MRLFLSCKIPEDIADYITELSKKLPEAKLSVPKNIDLTIKFMGNIPDNKVNEIKKRLSKIKFSSFKAMLNGIGVFTEDFIRVVWVGLTPSEKFEELNIQVNDLLKGLVPKEKRFQAHLTIARVKYVDDKKKFLAALKKIKIKPITFNVNELILFQSKLSPKGAIHEPLLIIKP